MDIARDSWRLPDELWRCMEPLLPPRKPHPLGCHRPRTPDRAAMDAILLVLRTGCPWKSVERTGLCTGSSAHRRFKEWTQAGALLQFWRIGLFSKPPLSGIDWSWLGSDGEENLPPVVNSEKPSYRDRRRPRPPSTWPEAQAMKRTG